VRVEKILTQCELTIDLSIPAMQHLVDTTTSCPWTLSGSVETEIWNFANCLRNLIERGVDKVPDPVPPSDNQDLI
jgi:hypothetical protein